VTLDASGRGGVTATANGVGGTYTVTAGAAGANGVAWHLTNVAIPPVVVGLRRTGVHRQPTQLVLSFSEPLDPARASDPRNYGLLLVGPYGRPGLDPHPIPVLSAAYDPAHRAVTVTPLRRLSLHGYYQLTVFGTPPRGLTSAAGVPLDGSGRGQPGTDFVAVVHGFGAVSPVPFPAGPLRVMPRATRLARAASALSGAARDR
jgi:hypothetical protein